MLIKTIFQVLFFEANRIFNDRLVTYEDKSKFEEIIQKIYADLRLNFKHEGDFIVLL
jgi:hypothetical protein